MRERALLSGALIVYFLSGYFGLGWLAIDGASARSLELPIDAALPFVLDTVFVYWSILPLALLPIFAVGDPALFRRVALAYALTISVALAIFVAFPVTSAGFRPDPATFSDRGFAGWLLRILYTLDPPLNLFPSLHLALAALAAMAAWCVSRTLGAFALLWTAAIAVSVCTTKQHFAVDALAGLALALIAHFSIVRWSPTAPSDRVTNDRAGLALFAALVALFYAGLFGAYLVGVEPWTWSIG